MITLIVPTYGGNIANLRRTIESCRGVVDDVVIISTCLYREDIEGLREVANSVVDLPWNYVYLHGFGAMMNQGSEAAKNDWLVLLGVAETIHAGHEAIQPRLAGERVNSVFECNHANDPHHWIRVWNRQSRSHWSGLIHESIMGGANEGLLFEMRDTEKIPTDDAIMNGTLRFVKTTLYNCMYRRLMNNTNLIGGTNIGWLDFVEGARGSIEDFCRSHDDLISAAMEGASDKFREAAEVRLMAGASPVGVNFRPQGEPHGN